MNLADIHIDEAAALEALSLMAQPAPRRPSASAETQRAVLIQEMARLARKLERLENDAIRLSRPLAHVQAFHESRKQIRILSGSNQSAKTHHGLRECALALRGCDPYKKYPLANGHAIFVGYDGDHLSNPIYTKLFEPGEFKLIKDEHTGKWRSVRPDPNNPRQIDPYDVAYKEKWKDAPPFIPENMVAEVAWEVASKRIPRNIRLTNGWNTLWRSSNARPPRGRQVHLVYLDEDLRNTNGWVNEMVPRLVKHGGMLIWAATAQEGGPELDELLRKAEQGSPHIDFFRLLIIDNPFISDEQREFFKEGMTNEEDLAVRFYGETAFSRKQVYRDYQANGMHGCEPFPIPVHKWARYVAIDPGRQHCGTVFLAVDPEERHCYVYDAIDLRNSNATEWAHEVAAREHGMKFEAFIVDQQIGKQTHIGRDHTNNVAMQYAKALKDAGVRPRRLGADPRLGGFFPGTNDIEAREEALIGWLTPRSTASPFAGTPKLQIMRGVSPELDRQIRLAKRDMANNREKRVPIQEDLLVCLEYAAAFNPGFHAPEIVSRPGSARPMTVVDRFKQKRERQRHHDPHREFGAAIHVGG